MITGIIIGFVTTTVIIAILAYSALERFSAGFMSKK